MNVDIIKVLKFIGEKLRSICFRCLFKNFEEEINILILIYVCFFFCLRYCIFIINFLVMGGF